MFTGSSSPPPPRISGWCISVRNWKRRTVPQRATVSPTRNRYASDGWKWNHFAERRPVPSERVTSRKRLPPHPRPPPRTPRICPFTGTVIPGVSDRRGTILLRSSYPFGKKKRASCGVRIPLAASFSASLGPTPLTYWMEEVSATLPPGTAALQALRGLPSLRTVVFLQTLDGEIFPHHVNHPLRHHF